MRYTVKNPGGTFDLDAAQARLQAEDPAAMLDLDASGTTLRLATVLLDAELRALVAAAAIGGGVLDLEREPSECCGGCGG